MRNSLNELCKMLCYKTFNTFLPKTFLLTFSSAKNLTFFFFDWLINNNHTLKFCSAGSHFSEAVLHLSWTPPVHTWHHPYFCFALALFSYFVFLQWTLLWGGTEWSACWENSVTSVRRHWAAWRNLAGCEWGSWWSLRWFWLLSWSASEPNPADLTHSHCWALMV